MSKPGPRPRWRPAYIGLGSNLDSPEEQIGRAIAAIEALADCAPVAQSSLYRSGPLGPSDQPDFVNAVVAILTTLDVRGLLARLQQIERDLGRVPGGERWGPRPIDLDLLVFSSETVDEPDLKIPHPGIAGRNFVLLPLVEIAPQLPIPNLGTASSVMARNDNAVPAIERLSAVPAAE